MQLIGIVPIRHWPGGVSRCSPPSGAPRPRRSQRRSVRIEIIQSELFRRATGKWDGKRHGPASFACRTRFAPSFSGGATLLVHSLLRLICVLSPPTTVVYIAANCEWLLASCTPRPTLLIARSPKLQALGPRSLAPASYPPLLRALARDPNNNVRRAYCWRCFRYPQVGVFRTAKRLADF